MRGIKDELRGAVVLLKLHNGRVRVVAFEVQYVADVGAAPRVDGLVVVAYHADVLVRRTESLDPQILRPVRVLVFVDVEVAPAALVSLQNRGRLVEEPHRLEQEVVEVESGGRTQPRLVSAIQPGDLALAVSVRVLRQELGVDHLVLRPRDCGQDRARLVLAGDRQVVVAQDLLHKGLLVVRVVDDEVRVDADGRAVAAQDARA